MSVACDKRSEPYDAWACIEYCSWSVTILATELTIPALSKPILKTVLKEHKDTVFNIGLLNAGIFNSVARIVTERAPSSMQAHASCGSLRLSQATLMRSNITMHPILLPVNYEGSFLIDAHLEMSNHHPKL